MDALLSLVQAQGAEEVASRRSLSQMQELQLGGRKGLLESLSLVYE